MEKQANGKLIRQKVMDAIASGRVVMRPRWQFVLSAVLAITGSAILLLALLFLASFILFTLRHTGLVFVPVFGSRGWYELLISLPWVLVLLLLFFIAVLEILVRRYSFAYRQPLLYSAFGIMLVALIGGVLIDRTPLHAGLFRYVEEGQIPLAERFYHRFESQRFQNVHLGTVLELTDDGFKIHDSLGDDLHIVVTPQTRLPLGFDFAEGDTVLVFGERDDDTVAALGVREISDAAGSDARAVSPRHFRLPSPLPIPIPLPVPLPQ